MLWSTAVLQKDNINVVVEPGKDKDTFDSYTKEVFFSGTMRSPGRFYKFLK